MESSARPDDGPCLVAHPLRQRSRWGCETGRGRAVTEAARWRAKARHRDGKKGLLMSVLRSTSSAGIARRQALLQARAREMRFAPTSTEALLWHQLRGRRLGVAFKRQVVVSGFIADFVASSRALIVEVDGDSYHRGRSSADASRERRLVRAGYTVLRLPASLVERRLAEAVALVRAALGRLE